MPITRQRKKFNSNKVSAPRARKYIGYKPKREFRKGGVQPKISYAAESPLPCWPRGVLASALINKFMIIAKGENHT